MSSRPIVVSGAADIVVALLCRIAELFLRSKQPAKQAMPQAQVIAGTAMAKQIIRKTLRPSFEPPEILRDYKHVCLNIFSEVRV